MLQFIYLGEVSFYHTNMNRFIQAAKDLQIKQLAESLITGNQYDNHQESTDGYHIKNEAEYENRIRSISIIAGEIINLNKPAFNPGSVSSLGSSKQILKCQECGATYKSNMGLWRHTKSKHERTVYCCKKCSYKATLQSLLKNHQQAVHEGVKYSCNQCKYKATTQGNLKIHQQGLHENVKYSCNQCEYKATARRSLKIHQENIHEGVKYSCNQCEFLAGQKNALKLHERRKHFLIK